MNRPIKFRAWLTEDYPDEIMQNIMLKPDELSMDGGLDGHEAGNVILMQYTGLQDKNGTEIYEGDVLAFDKYEWYRGFGKDFIDEQGLDDHKFVVDWNSQEARFSVDGTCRDLAEYAEVIGNIYENPELLEKETA